MYDKIYEAIGNTPLVKVDFECPAEIYAKLEYLNPGQSIKDRAALAMIEEAEASGKLKPGGTIVEASSGNQGIALAMIGASKGYKVVITTPKKTSVEKVKTLKAFGAEVILCDSINDTSNPNHYHKIAVRKTKEIPGAYMTDQYMNIENAEGHYKMTGPEIWRQTNGKITHFFAASGSCGTISGTGKFLKEKNPNVKVIAFDIATSWYSTGGNPKPYKVEGPGIDFDTPVLYRQYIDEIIPITDEQAFSMIKPIAVKTGILGGLSSGLVAYGVNQYVKKMKEGDLGVMIFGDSARAYLSKLEF
ncbi:MAG TPA: cysteine synthase family protein [Elusimicrobiales bacterium]|nr:cysteine synthase family protein [Elusimicrobiales bacterium]